MTMNFSQNVMSPTSNCNSIVAIGASNCPIATRIWNPDTRPSIFLCLEPVIEFCVNWLPEWRLTQHPNLWAPRYLITWNPLENEAFCVYFLMASLLIVGETLWVHLVLPGAVVKFGRQWLQNAFVGFVVSTESSVLMMYLLNVNFLSTNLAMHIVISLIRVHP